jgi:hypothetical protein
MYYNTTYHLDKLDVTTTRRSVRACREQGERFYKFQTIIFFQKRLIVFCLFFFPSLVSFAQQKPERPKEDDLKKEIIYQNKRYKVYNNWISAGAGPAHNSNTPRTQFSIFTDYSFHIQKQYAQFGILLSGDHYGKYNNVQAHLCYGLRKETEKYNLSAFIGPSYTSGALYLDTAYSNKSFKVAGLYAAVQFIGKVKYDVGIGPSLFADVNAKRTIVGIRLDLYFSGAYKGPKERF